MNAFVGVLFTFAAYEVGSVWLWCAGMAYIIAQCTERK